MRIFDRALHARRRSRAAARFGDHSFLKQIAAEDIAARLGAINRQFDRVLDLGAHDGLLARTLRQDPFLAPRLGEIVTADLAAAFRPDVIADEEALPFAEGSFDLVVSALSLHWVNDLPGALIQLRMALKPDGLFLASIPALGTLGELRAALTEAEAMVSGGASPRVSPFPDLRDAAGLLQRAGFALPVADADEVVLAYANPLELLRDLRAAGEGNAVRLRDRRVPPRGLFAAALAGMKVHEGRVPATLRLAMLTGWAPAAGQPKPAARGSGQMPLGEALR
jgi:SAM-dependent methyltransferase